MAETASEFLTKCDLQIADDKDDGQWILMYPLYYRSELLKRTIVVPAGTKTDLASVPRIPIVFLLCGDTSREAAVLHDYLYQSKLLSREMSDAILREASAATGVPAWRRNMMWAGVRLFGGLRWK